MPFGDGHVNYELELHFYPRVCRLENDPDGVLVDVARRKPFAGLAGGSPKDEPS